MDGIQLYVIEAFIIGFELAHQCCVGSYDQNVCIIMQKLTKHAGFAIILGYYFHNGYREILRNVHWA